MKACWLCVDSFSVNYSLVIALVGGIGNVGGFAADDDFVADVVVCNEVANSSAVDKSH